MIVETSTGKKYHIQVTYKRNPKSAYKHDEYGRKVHTYWAETDTMVFISEWKEKMPSAMTKFIGIAHCSYKDKFSRKTGRKIAYAKALHEMVKLNLLTSEELIELVCFDLNSNNKSFNKE